MSPASTEQRILDAALRLFRDQGFHAVGVAVLGREAGIKGPSIYKHFASKDEILAALFTQAMHRLQSRLGVAHDDPWRELDALIAGTVAFALHERDHVIVYAQERRALVDPWDRAVRRHVLEHLARWERAIAGCRPELSVVERRSAAWGVNEMLLSLASAPREVRDGAGLPALMRTLVRDGLRNLAAGGSSGPAAIALDTGSSDTMASDH